MSPRGFLLKLDRPIHLDIAPERLPHGTVLRRRQLYRAQRVVLREPLSADAEVERDVLLAPGNSLDALSYHVDLERLDRSALLREDVDHIVGDAGRQRAEKRFRRTLSRLTLAIDAGRRTIRIFFNDTVTTDPIDVYQRGFRGRFRRCRCCHFSGPFSIGARTALPHSVQLPS